MPEEEAEVPAHWREGIFWINPYLVEPVNELELLAAMAPGKGLKNPSKEDEDYPGFWPDELGSNAGADSYAKMWSVNKPNIRRHHTRGTSTASIKNIPVRKLGIYFQARSLKSIVEKKPITEEGTEGSYVHVYEYEGQKGEKWVLTVYLTEPRKVRLIEQGLNVREGHGVGQGGQKRRFYRGVTYRMDRFKRFWEPVHDLQQLAFAAHRNPHENYRSAVISMPSAAQLGGGQARGNPRDRNPARKGSPRKNPMLAKRNSQLRLPPAMIGPVSDFVAKNWDTHRTKSKTFAVDLTDWAYGGSVEDLPPRMQKIKVSLVPPSSWKGAGAVGVAEGLHQGRPLAIRLLAGRGRVKTAGTLKHELGHIVQALQRTLTGHQFAGLPPGAGHDGASFQHHWFAGEEGHAQDPYEFYTRMGDLVDELAGRFAHDYVSAVSASYKRKKKGSAFDMVMDLLGGGSDPSLGEDMGPLQPHPGKPVPFFNDLFQKHAMEHPTIAQLREAHPDRFRKMVGEVYTQALGSYGETLSGVLLTEKGTDFWLRQRLRKRRDDRIEVRSYQHEAENATLSDYERRSRAAKRGWRGVRQREKTHKRLYGARQNPMIRNPARKGSEDTYDPREFQLQAQTTAIFDSLLGGKDPRRMSQPKVDELVSRAFAIATGSERRAPKPKTVKRGYKKVEVHKGSWIVPGTRKPTQRTATASKKRYEGTYVGSDGKRRTITDLVIDRQAYELMLAMRRKKSRTTRFYRVTREPTREGNRYFVWPMPPGCRIPGPGTASYDEATAIVNDLNNRANPYRNKAWWRPSPRNYTKKELAGWLPPTSVFSLTYDLAAGKKKARRRRTA